MIGRWPLGRPWLGRTVASIMKLPGGKTLAPARTRSRPRGRELRLHLPLPPLPPPLWTQSAVRTDARKKKQYIYVKKQYIYIFILFILFYFGSCCRLEKRKKIKIRFSVFNPQDPRDPRDPPAKPWEEEGFFGLVPLVTHPSSIPLLGGLTPKFLSLSLHSL
jgi:hypothetical protein